MAFPGRMFIARHGETVFNAARRMQGQYHLHTPLTRAGFVQADVMGADLAAWLGTHQTLELWSSTAGRALQTMAIIAEHIGADWHLVSRDDRLQEIDVGAWSGRSYAELAVDSPGFLDIDSGLFTAFAPDGEDYIQVAARLRSWLADLSPLPIDRLVVMHGMSSRVLRGILLGLAPDPVAKVPVAPSLPQGSMVMFGGGEEKIIRFDPSGDSE